jgi:hypothetical protein
LELGKGLIDETHFFVSNTQVVAGFVVFIAQLFLNAYLELSKHRFETGVAQRHIGRFRAAFLLGAALRLKKWIGISELRRRRILLKLSSRSLQLLDSSEKLGILGTPLQKFTKALESIFIESKRDTLVHLVKRWGRLPNVHFGNLNQDIFIPFVRGHGKNVFVIDFRLRYQLDLRQLIGLNLFLELILSFELFQFLFFLFFLVAISLRTTSDKHGHSWMKTSTLGSDPFVDVGV